MYDMTKGHRGIVRMAVNAAHKVVLVIHYSAQVVPNSISASTSFRLLGDPSMIKKKGEIHTDINMRTT